MKAHERKGRVGKGRAVQSAGQDTGCREKVARWQAGARKGEKRAAVAQTKRQRRKFPMKGRRRGKGCLRMPTRTGFVFGLLRGHKALALSPFALATQCECINKQILNFWPRPTRRRMRVRRRRI